MADMLQFVGNLTRLTLDVAKTEPTTGVTIQKIKTIAQPATATDQCLRRVSARLGLQLRQDYRTFSSKL